jgi:hypothetical protein
MTSPEAVRKHDGRVVAFDAAKLADSIRRAAASTRTTLAPEAVERLVRGLADAAGAALLLEGRTLPATADIRTCVIKLLHRTRHDGIATSYAEHARTASSLVWRVRVVEPGMAAASTAGSPWDRRRLLESLRAAGVARDPAGEAAREVERRIVALAQDRISPALIHALAALVLSERGVNAKAYAARRLAFAMSAHVPRYDPAAAVETPLPQGGAALAAFWLQAVHSQEVVQAAADNLLSLEPYPSGPEDAQPPCPLPQAESGAALLGKPAVAQQPRGEAAEALDPLQAPFASALRDWCNRGRGVLWVRAEDGERAAAVARYLALLPASLAPQPASGAAVEVVLSRGAGAISASRTAHDTSCRGTRLQRAWPVTLNLAGLMVREAVRDQARATVRLAQLVSVAAQAHREREEYFGLSPVRGRQLPVAIAGLWNAAAWLGGESFECRQVTRNVRTVAVTLASIVHGAVETLRNETEMELSLIGSAPAEATLQLWRLDRAFLQRDGVTLDAALAYDGGPAVKLLGGEDLPERVDFVKAVAGAFDEPAAVVVEAPLGEESDAGSWRELLAVFAQAGAVRLRLIPGGGVRAQKTLVRAMRSHLEGLPLFEQSLES